MGGAALIPMVISGIGTIVQMSAAGQAADAARRQAQAQADADAFRAAQLRQNAGQQIASSQRGAADERRRASLVASRAIAIAGASGGGVSDPSVVNLIGDITGEGAYRAAVKLYQGEENSRQMEMGATVADTEGRNALQTGEEKASGYRMQQLGSLASGAGSMYGMYKRYGNGGPSSMYNSGGVSEAGDSWGEALMR